MSLKPESTVSRALAQLAELPREFSQTDLLRIVKSVAETPERARVLRHELARRGYTRRYASLTLTGLDALKRIGTK